MPSFLHTLRLWFIAKFTADTDVAKRDLFDAESDEYLRYLRHVREEARRENAISAALLERSRDRA